MPKAKSVGKVAKKTLTKVITLIAWVVGVLVALAVGFGMEDGTLKVPGLELIVPTAGWIVIILVIVGVIMEIIDAVK